LSVKPEREPQLYLLYHATQVSYSYLSFIKNMNIPYDQSRTYTPSDFIFLRDTIAEECTPNIETIVINEVDLER
jgi:hypothetical protein